MPAMILTLIVLFIVVFTVCAAVSARSLARMGRQLARTGAELERLGGRMEAHFLPRVEQVMEQTDGALRDLEAVGADARLVTAHIEDALAAVGDVTVMAEDAVHPIVATAASMGVDLRHLRAVRAGAGAMISRLFGRRPDQPANPRD